MSVTEDRLKYDAPDTMIDLSGWANDEKLLAVAHACVEASRHAARHYLSTAFRPSENALEAVGEKALHAAMTTVNQAPDISIDRKLSNCIAFDLDRVSDVVASREVRALRKVLDEMVHARLSRLFYDEKHIRVMKSGHFFYPPGSFMRWHTNLRTPGWRMYINYADEPGQSFFRYRDPDSGKVITLKDKLWNFRIFRINPARPLWHAVYSDTNRFSFGYAIIPRRSLGARLIHKIRSVLSRHRHVREDHAYQ